MQGSVRHAEEDALGSCPEGRRQLRLCESDQAAVQGDGGQRMLLLKGQSSLPFRRLEFEITPLKTGLIQNGHQSDFRTFKAFFQ